MRVVKKIICIILVALTYSACKKSDPVEPSINDIYAPVVITQAFDKALASPNFGSNDVEFFIAKFEKQTVWTITLKGQTSGAVKVIKGISNEINADNSSWQGYADAAISFRTENVIATLTFDNDPGVTASTALNIASIKNKDAGGVLVSNFVVSKRYYNSGPPCNCHYGYTGTDGWPSDYPNIINTDNTYSKPDGDNYLLMSGVPWPDPTVSAYVNYLTIPASTVGYGNYFPLYGDATQVYLNLMVYGTRSETPNTWIEINIAEEDGSTRSLSLKPNWTGWKLISVRYSDLTSSATTIYRPDKAVSLQLVLLSDAATLPGPSVKAAFDHIIFTHNQPYQP